MDDETRKAIRELIARLERGGFPVRQHASQHQAGGIDRLPGGASLTVREIDLAPSVANVDTIEFTNGSVTDIGGGVVRVTVGGGANHNLLDGSVHPDTALDAVTDGDTIIGNATPKWSSLAISVPAADILNVLGVVNAETRPSWKSAMDATAPTTQAFGDAASAGTGVKLARVTHKHGLPANPVTAHEAAADPHTGYLLESLHGVFAEIATPAAPVNGYTQVFARASATLWATELCSIAPNGDVCVICTLTKTPVADELSLNLVE